MSPSDAVNPEHRQHHAHVRLEWGPTGAQALLPADLAVVVDVLSFTTTLTVAVERGITVFPYRWRDDSAIAYAAERDATLAVGRLEALGEPGRVSLSAASLASADGIERLVLPSPNGSIIAHLLQTSGAQVIGGCLRNASAVAMALAPRVAAGESVAVIAAGERWPDGSLRPAIEDLWGAGAILAALADRIGPDPFSREAQVVLNAWATLAHDPTAALLDCSSGRELVAAGFGEDVEIAAQVDATAIVPVLVAEAFVAG